MFLSILLPTYNRANDLKKNLNNISSILRSLDLCQKVDVIISNNASTDETEDICLKFIEDNGDICIKYYLQSKNLGIEKNSIFTLSKSESEYIMFLGDDDYFEAGYLKAVIDKLSNDKQIGCILPSWQGVYPNGALADALRDIGTPNQFFNAGVGAVIDTAWRAHQLSGVTLRREKLYDTYMNQKVHTIYPHIYLASVALLNNNGYLCTEFPLLITQPGQAKKDWDYGKDGLINEKLEGYKCLPTNWWNRNRIQVNCLIRERNVITGYANHSLLSFALLVKSVLFGRHILMAARIFMFVNVLYLILRGVIRKFLGWIKF